MQESVRYENLFFFRRSDGVGKDDVAVMEDRREEVDFPQSRESRLSGVAVLDDHAHDGAVQVLHEEKFPVI